MINFVLRLLKWLPWAGVVLLLAGFGIAIHEKAFHTLAGALSIVGVLLFLLIFVHGESANVKFYVNVILASLITLAILTVLYMWVNVRKKEWDFTQEKRYSLSDQTTKYLDALKTPVKIVGLFSETTQPPATAAREFLDRYAKRSKNIEIEIVDPVQEMQRVRELKDLFDTDVRPSDIFVYNAATVEEGKVPRFKKASGLDESPITNALIQVTQEKQKVVYVLQGHGEKTIEYQPATKKDTSISDFKAKLTDRGMKVETLQLAGFVPDDASLVFAPGPTADLFKPEEEALQKHLDNGGRMLIYFDPPTRPDQTLPNWADLLKNYGVDLTDNIVLDYAGASVLGDPTVIIPSDFDDNHEITKDFKQPQMVVQGARAMKRADNPPSNYTVTELIKTSKNAWDMSYKDLLDWKGTLPAESAMKAEPLALAVSASGDEKGGTRLVVFGNAGMISDAGLNQMSFALGILSVNWLSGEEDLVAIPPRELKDTPLFLREDTMNMIFILIVVALPAAVFFGGLSYTMYRRRSR
ncbi:MAG: GldG family protein [Candidatus Sumerlaeota bacterium]|nr:GldG family protein [Candidatus Sumerlaeota bacterium]